MEVVKIAALLADEKFELRIDLLAGEAGLSRRITSARIQKPGLALAGFLDHEGSALSIKATSGFYRRARAAKLRFADGFLDAVERHLAFVSEKPAAEAA